MKKKRSSIIIAVFLVVAIFITAYIILGERSPQTEKNETTTAAAATDSTVTTVHMQTDDVNKGTLILVNATNKYKFSEEINLVTVYSQKTDKYGVKDTLIKVQDYVMEPLNRMLDDFYKEHKNKTLNIISCHRTFEYQENLLNEKTKEVGAAEAATWVAQPGASEHHTGLAMDFSIYNSKSKTGASYDGSGDFEWIKKNCHKYGFIVRFDEAKKDITGISNEPWHFRYIGLPHSALVSEKGFCYEEYIDYLRQFPYEGEHLTANVEGKNYEIFFTNKTDIKVPKNSVYNISGNNVDGFIVTIEK